MKAWIYPVIGIGLLTINPGAAQSGKPNPAQHGWHLSLETGKAAAKKSGKPLMVVFRCDP